MIQDKEYRLEWLSRVKKRSSGISERTLRICMLVLSGKAGPVSPSPISISPDRPLNKSHMLQGLHGIRRHTGRYTKRNAGKPRGK